MCVLYVCEANRVQGSQNNWPNFKMACKSCGSIGCYADDTTYTCSGSFSVALSAKLTRKYQLMSDFFVSNKLKLNYEGSNKYIHTYIHTYIHFSMVPIK